MLYNILYDCVSLHINMIMQEMIDPLRVESMYQGRKHVPQVSKKSACRELGTPMTLVILLVQSLLFIIPLCIMFLMSKHDCKISPSHISSVVYKY